MKRIIFPLLLCVLLSCVQDYPNEFKWHVDNICECMNYRNQLRRDDIPKNAQYIYDDIDYKECVLDAIIDQIDLKGKEFKAAIKDLCPAYLETHSRYCNEFN